VLSAFGTLVTPVRLDLVRSALRRLDGLDWQETDRLLTEMSAEGLAALEAAGCRRAAIELRFGADLRYAGQQNEVGVFFDFDPRSRRDSQAVRAVFEAAYKAQYGVNPAHVAIEVVNWRVSAQGPEPALSLAQRSTTQAGNPKSARAVPLWPNAGRVPVYDRNALGVGQCLSGPVIIEERETTIVILPNWAAALDAMGSIVATREAVR
jgi:N-methylhydantoinase A